MNSLYHPIVNWRASLGEVDLHIGDGGSQIVYDVSSWFYHGGELNNMGHILAHLVNEVEGSVDEDFIIGSPWSGQDD